PVPARDRRRRRLRRHLASFSSNVVWHFPGSPAFPSCPPGASRQRRGHPTTPPTRAPPPPRGPAPPGRPAPPPPPLDPPRARPPRAAVLARRARRGSPSTRCDDVALRGRPLAASAAVACRWQRVPEPAILMRPRHEGGPRDDPRYDRSRRRARGRLARRRR